MIKAIIFDCFGVIYPDTLGIVQRHYKADKKTKLQIQKLRISCDKGDIDRETFWNTAAKLLKTSRQELELRLEGVRGADWELLDYIKELKKDYKTAIISNVGRGFIERIFDHNHPQINYFDEIVVSGELGILKPDPKIYMHTVKQLGVKPYECIYTDDKEELVRGAQKIGMKSFKYIDLDDVKT